jgi:PilZ domain
MSSTLAKLVSEPEERRRHPRTDVDQAAYISSGGSSTRCQVVNISAEGAAIEVPDPVFVPARFQLMTENDRVIRNCRIVWTKQSRIGVIFE